MASYNARISEKIYNYTKNIDTVMEKITGDKIVKVKCPSCGSDVVVSVSSPGYSVVSCPSCASPILILADQNLDIRDVRKAAMAETLDWPRRRCRIADEALIPANLRQLLPEIKAFLNDPRRRLSKEAAAALEVLEKMGYIVCDEG